MRLHNRQIKAQFWMDGEIMSWPVLKQLFYLGMTQLCDDSGCLEHDCGKLKGMLFPLKPEVTPEVLEGYLEELVTSRKLIPYRVRRSKYLYLKNFFRHQTLRSPSPPDAPLPKWVVWVPAEVKYRSGDYVVLAPYGNGSFVTGSRKDEPYAAARSSRARQPEHDQQVEPVPDAPAPATPKEKRTAAGRGEGRIPDGYTLYNGVLTPLTDIADDYLGYLAAHADNPKLQRFARLEQQRRQKDGPSPPCAGNAAYSLDRLVGFVTAGSTTLPPVTVRETVFRLANARTEDDLPSDPTQLQLLVARAVREVNEGAAEGVIAR